MNRSPWRIQPPHNGRSHRIRLLILLGVNTMAMCSTIDHIFFEEPVRTFDWWMLAIEGVVLALIAVEVFLFSGPEWMHKRKAAKKAKLLLPVLKSGELLRDLASVNPNQHNNKWREDFLKWDKETQEFIAKLSPRALSAFRHVVYIGGADRAVLTPSGQFYPAHGLFGDAHQLLQGRLSNLQKIMGNPEVYF